MAAPIPPDDEDFYRAPRDPGGQAPAHASLGNGMAVASLVCGLTCWATPIPSILAILFGVIGIRKTRDPSVSGRGMAVSGLALGMTGLLLWGFLGTGFGFLIRYYLVEQEQAQTAAETFVQDLAEGKMDEAMALALPSVERSKMLAIRERTKPWGPLSYFRVDVNQGTPMTGNGFPLRWLIEGSTIFSRAAPEVSMSLVKDGDSYKVERFDMR